MITTIRLLVITLAVLSFTTQASDLGKEKRWADQIVDAILDGDAVWLDDGNSEFLGIYTEAVEDKGRAVIVMHGTGIHPDWQQVVQPLRVGLTEYNWNTLSIQMPVLGNEAEYPEYAPLYDEVAPRINAAIKYLQDNGSDNIVLIGHSQGAAMTAYYLSTSRQDVNGFVAIGMASFADDPRMNSIRALEKINVPVLELNGDEELELVRDGSRARAESANKPGNKKNTQDEKSASNHFIDGNEYDHVESVAE